MNPPSILASLVSHLVLLLLIDSCLIIGSTLCKRSHHHHSSSSGGGSGGSGKKKVVIIGEMSDLAFEMATNASASTNYAIDDVTFADYNDSPASSLVDEESDGLSVGSRFHRPSSSASFSKTYGSSRGRTRARIPWGQGSKRTTSGLAMPASSPAGSVFVPVAAYSVTHSRVGSSPSSVRRMRPGTG